MKKIVFCCLLFVGIVCIGCQNKDNSNGTVAGEANIDNNETVVEEIDMVVEENDNNKNAKLNDLVEKGENALEKGNLDEAIDLFTKALEINDKADWVYGDLGRAKAEKKDFDGAIECYTKAIELNGGKSVYYFWRAGVYREQGKKDLEEKDQKIAEEMNAKGMD